jgi:hypothetical protein
MDQEREDYGEFGRPPNPWRPAWVVVVATLVLLAAINCLAR